MVIKEEDFKKIIDYTKSELLKHLIFVNKIGIHEPGEQPIPINAVSEWTIRSMSESITLKGFLEGTSEKKERAKSVPVTDDKGFEEFWKTYPATPTFRHKGRSFMGSRTLRSNKQVCMNKYLAYLHDHSDITPELMLKALHLQLKMAKDESVEEGKNRLNHWNGLEVYLNQRKFEAWLEIATQEKSEFSEESEENNSNYA